MAENTGIDWTDHTWNPWIGCRKISSGCSNCYMFRDMKRFAKDPMDIKVTSDKNFNLPYSLSKKHPHSKVFVCSWSDFFLADMCEPQNKALKIMSDCSNLHFQLLTKRPQNILSVFSETDVPSNVSIGVTIESSDYYERISFLSNIKARSRFISVEPILSSIDIGTIISIGGFLPDLVIVGGESGPGFRESSIRWYEKIILDCKTHNIPVFVKQISGFSINQTKKIPEHINIKQLPMSWLPDFWNINK